VLPIGGLKEKILGACRAGITRIVIPKENEPDLEDLPDEVLEMVDVYPIQELGEALALTLRGATYREGKLLFANDDPKDVVALTQGFMH
jgi:ATP-dependent Lon protease